MTAEQRVCAAIRQKVLEAIETVLFDPNDIRAWERVSLECDEYLKELLDLNVLSDYGFVCDKSNNKNGLTQSKRGNAYVRVDLGVKIIGSANYIRMIIRGQELIEDGLQVEDPDQERAYHGAGRAFQVWAGEQQ